MLALKSDQLEHSDSLSQGVIAVVHGFTKVNKTVGGDPSTSMLKSASLLSKELKYID